MQKLLIFLLFGASLLVSGCSSQGPIAKSLELLPFMYVQDIQQGNVVTQEMVNRLRPGMSKNQVTFVMGSPMLIDVFHLERWDYYHSIKPGKKKREEMIVSLFFEDERLVQITGDLKPGVPDSTLDLKEADIITVPDNKQNENILDKAIEYIGWD